MAHTSGGRVTDDHLDHLDETARRHRRPWTMGVGSYVMQALIDEVREHRRERGATPCADVSAAGTRRPRVDPIQAARRLDERTSEAAVTGLAVTGLDNEPWASYAAARAATDTALDNLWGADTVALLRAQIRSGTTGHTLS